MERIKKTANLVAGPAKIWLFIRNEMELFFLVCYDLGIVFDEKNIPQNRIFVKSEVYSSTDARVLPPSSPRQCSRRRNSCCDVVLCAVGGPTRESPVRSCLILRMGDGGQVHLVKLFSTR